MLRCRLCVSLCHDGVGGKFIVDCREKRSSDESCDEAKARRLWELSAVWCGLSCVKAAAVLY